MKPFLDSLRQNRLIASIVRHGWPNTRLNQALVITNNFFLHLHPVKIPRHALRFTYTFGLGGLAVLLFAVLTITGGLLMLYYVPSTEVAYDLMKDLRFTVPYGRLLRNLHRWAAHGMVIIVLLHLCRVFYTGAYKRPREFNWVVGFSLFVLTLGLAFTGYLLPWDQLAYWAINVGTEILQTAPLIGKWGRELLLGAEHIGQNALLRFYALHVFFLPLIMGLLMGIHVWRVRKDGGISMPESELTTIVLDLDDNEEDRPRPEAPLKTYDLVALPRGVPVITEREPENLVMTFPHLVFKEFTVAIAALALLLIISFVFDAPLEQLADPEKTPNPAKAPWYFLGLQEMLSWGPPIIGGVIVPTVVSLVLMALPYFDRSPRGVGEWCASQRWRAVVLFTAVLLFFTIITILGTLFRGPNWRFTVPW
ncbi:MAG: cytochrome bc complex cytochrome b subunit [Candidatus Tectomicrobia bacterium]|nr:cytochrome bc complex cytochrome b subunit [Candidatus Tectomicrobia bacterium]